MCCRSTSPEVVLSLRDIIQCLDDDRDTKNYIRGKEDDQWAEALVVFKADAIQTVLRSTSQTVELVRARDLKATSLDGHSDPFATVHLDDGSTSLTNWNKRRQRTYYVSKTLNPVWNETFLFDVPRIDPRALSLHIHVYDFAAVRINELGKFLGYCKIPLYNLISNDERDVPKEEVDRTSNIRSPPANARSPSLRRSSSSTSSFGKRAISAKGFPFDGPRSFPRVSECDHILAGRTEGSCMRRRDEEVHGTIFVRVQWIHSAEELLLYHLIMVRKEEQEIKERLKQIIEQRERLKNSTNRQNMKKIKIRRKRKKSDFDVLGGIAQLKAAFRLNSSEKTPAEQEAGRTVTSRVERRGGSTSSAVEHKATLKHKISQKMSKVFERLSNHEGKLFVKPLEANVTLRFKTSWYLYAHIMSNPQSGVSAAVSRISRSRAVRAAWHGVQEFPMSIGPESSDSFEFVVDTYQPRDLRISLLHEI